MVGSGPQFSLSAQPAVFIRQSGMFADLLTLVETLRLEQTKQPGECDQIKYNNTDMLYSVACCWRRRVARQNQQVATLRDRVDHLHHDTASLYKTIDLATIADTLRELTDKVNELQKKGSRSSIEDDFPFVKQDDNAG